MSGSVGLHTQLAAVMESLVHAAVAELKKLVEHSNQVQIGTSRTMDGQEQHLSAKEQGERREKMVRRMEWL